MSSSNRGDIEVIELPTIASASSSLSSFLLADVIDS